MKKLTFKSITLLLLCVVIIGVSACKKDNEDDPGTDPDTAGITLKVNGVTYEPYLIQDVDIGFGLNVIGSFADGKHGLTIVFESDVTVGIHDLSDINSRYGLYWDDVISMTNIERYFSRSGSIVVNEYNAETGKLVGTFSGTCKTLDDSKSLTVTDGTFLVYI